MNTTNPSVPPTPTPSLPGGRFDSPRLHQSPLTIDEAPAAAVGETDLMTLPPGDGVLSSTWLNSALDRSPDWPHGAIRAISASRVGVGYGMSGRIHRVVGDTERGGSRSLVVKQETAEAVERELLFRGECAEAMQGSIARCYGGMVDVDAGRGVLLLEDIQAAEQGDVLRGCTEEAALAALGALPDFTHGRGRRPMTHTQRTCRGGVHGRWGQTFGLTDSHAPANASRRS